MKLLSNAELEQLYEDANTCDKAIFAEMRSNLLLVSGDHYAKRKKEVWDKIRGHDKIPQEAKLRITKNHTQKITGFYETAIIGSCPGVTIMPDIETETQDQKAAELNQAVWRDGKSRFKFNELFREYCQDFVEIGEVAAAIIWDKSKGPIIGYSPLLDKSGKPVMVPGPEQMDPMTGMSMPGEPQMVPDKDAPVFRGDFVFKKIHGFNLLRKPEAKNMKDSPYLIIREMANVADLLEKYKGDKDKLSYITESQDETYMVFDGATAKYRDSKGEVMIKSYFFRPCQEYPRGYFYIKTQGGVLEHGELPFGIFNIVFKEYNKIQTSCRGRSIIKQIRPFQIEINRAASQMATHQVTWGDDKLVVNTNTKMENGGLLPGVRVIRANGAGEIKVLPGRTGEQYLNYAVSQVQELYQVLNCPEALEDKDVATDPFLMIFKSMKQKKKFSMPITKFEEFLCEFAELFLTLAKEYYPDDMLIPAVGKREVINLEEFRNTEALNYQIKVEPQVDDIETKYGKQMVMNHTLQYVGAQLEKDDIGRILKNMPFANVDESFDDMTIDYENVRNDILQLERGQIPEVTAEENHDYAIKKLTHRMKAADFQFLSPEIKQAFMACRQEHQVFKVKQMQELQRAEAGFIPTGGYLVKCDMYQTTGDGKTKRISLPYESVQWLVKKLEEQGMAQENLESMQKEAQAGLAQAFNEHNNVRQIGVMNG